MSNRANIKVVAVDGTVTFNRDRHRSYLEAFASGEGDGLEINVEDGPAVQIEPGNWYQPQNVVMNPLEFSGQGVVFIS